MCRRCRDHDQGQGGHHEREVHERGRSQRATYKGTVQLSGFVKTAADQEKAVALARGVKGVTQVKDDIIVR